MPTIEVRSLDLRTSEVTAELLPRGSGRITARELNYVWIYVQDITTQAEVALRFQVVDNRLLFRSPHDVVDQAVIDIRNVDLAADAELVWRATMVHFPATDVVHTEVSLVSVGDYLEVDALNVRGETLVVAKIKLGVITKILLPGQ
jgi:hypothetical protein